ncbi:hypothetical protein BHM03_00049660 [Ensete ventricosum]|nr:hypothetical protein BHM03_00049660 [Ensete ventricosum]
MHQAPLISLLQIAPQTGQAAPCSPELCQGVKWQWRSHVPRAGMTYPPLLRFWLKEHYRLRILDCIQYDFTGFSGPYAAPHAACLLCCSLKPLGCHFSHGQSVERVGGASEDFERFRACSSYQNKIENENTRAHPKVFDRSMSTLQLPGAILRTSIHFEHPFQHHKALTAC